MAMDEDDGIVICCTGRPSDDSTKLFCQTDRSGIVVNGTLDDPGLWEFDMGVGRNGHIYLIAKNSRDLLQVLTNTAGIGERISDLSYSILLEFLAGTLIIVGVANSIQQWRVKRHLDRK